MIAKVKENWFWPLAITLMAVAWLIAQFSSMKPDAAWEYAIVFDVLVTLPILFFLCYRNKNSLKINLLGIVALQCSGIWLATKIVPVESQNILPYLSWLRIAGLALLFLLEVGIMLALIKVVFRADTTTTQVEQLGVPPFVAKLLLMEARFWRRVFSIFKR